MGIICTSVCQPRLKVLGQRGEQSKQESEEEYQESAADPDDLRCQSLVYSSGKAKGVPPTHPGMA